jgi:hypothetical protein
VSGLARGDCIVNLIENEILKGMSHSDPERIEKRAKNFGDLIHDPQHYESKLKLKFFSVPFTVYTVNYNTKFILLKAYFFNLRFMLY